MYKLFALAALCALSSAASSLTCTPAAVPANVRAEGLTERLGDIVLSCQGTPNAAVSGSLTLFVPVPVTNRLLPGDVIDATLTTGADTTQQNSTGATASLTGTNAVTFANASFTTSSAGTAYLRISNLRAAVAGFGVDHPITATLSWAGDEVLFTGVQVVAGVPRPGLLAGTFSGLINCQGSPLPSTINVANLAAAQTASSTVRITEGFFNAFEPGVRFAMGYTGFPAGARLFVPDAIAGTAGTLALVRVIDDKALTGADPASASEVPLTDGAGVAVFEVKSADPVAIESARITTWMGLAPTGGATTSAPRQSIMFAPVSDVAAASADAPVPRFVASEPAPDCGVMGDCSSFPQMTVKAPALDYTARSGGPALSGWINVVNAGGGTLGWTAYISYKTGSRWAELRFSAPSRNGGGGVQLVLRPQALQAGVYEATLTVDGGAAGLQNFPVKLTVTEPDGPVPLVAAVVHAATWAEGPLVPGSLATIAGARLAGRSVSVTFDNFTAPLLYTGDKQINFMVPAELARYYWAQMVVTVDGLRSQPLKVDLTPMSPGIFANGILNEDGSLNEKTNGAAGDSVIQVFATGLPPAGVGTVTAKIHDQWIPVPDYAGPAPGLMGVHQVNLRVPAGWPPMTTSVIVCATSLKTGVRTCSPEAPLTVK
ncbi:MAG: hypothetical protein ACM336_20980 [Acidobacteriota bacterium]